jgi:hypothetical protein
MEKNDPETSGKNQEDNDTSDKLSSQMLHAGYSSVSMNSAPARSRFSVNCLDYTLKS